MPGPIIGGSSFNPASPGPIGGTTPAAITATTLTAGVGSIAAPSITFGDPDTGLYSNGNLFSTTHDGVQGWQFGLNGFYAQSAFAQIGAGSYTAANRPVLVVGNGTSGVGAPAANQVSLIAGSGSLDVLIASSTLLTALVDLSVPTKTPASATATGVTGTISWDASYIYICTATNTWKRAAITTWV